MKWMLLILLLSVCVFAHEQRTLQIGNDEYVIVFGNLNEPIAIDDKTGVDLKVYKLIDGNRTPVEGLENAFKVDIIADGTTKSFDLSPVWRTPGAYYTPYYPTVETTYKYKVKGALAGRQFTLDFTCSHKGHVMHEEEKPQGEQQLSSGVKQIAKAGSFGCPHIRTAFPVQTKTIAQLEQEVKRVEELTVNLMFLAILAGVLAIVAMVRTWKR